VVRTTIVSLVIIGLVLLISDFNLLMTRVAVAAIILLLILLGIEVNRETNNLIAAENKAQKHAAEIKTLRGILPICTHCKNIRDDKGAWNQIEGYIHSHSDAEFSHGICPHCAKTLYPDFWRRYTQKQSKPPEDPSNH